MTSNESQSVSENGNSVDRQLQRAMQDRVLPSLPWELQPKKKLKTLADLRADRAVPVLGYIDFLKAALTSGEVAESQVQPGLPVQGAVPQPRSFDD